MPVVSLHAQVRRVAQLFPTAIISGRGREKVQQFVQLAELYYAGRWVQLPRMQAGRSMPPRQRSVAERLRCPLDCLGHTQRCTRSVLLRENLLCQAARARSVLSPARLLLRSHGMDIVGPDVEGTPHTDLAFQPAAQYEPLMDAVYEVCAVVRCTS